jgi:uncharacterized membrane protein
MAESNDDDDDSRESAQPEIDHDSQEESVRARRTTTELSVQRFQLEFSGPLPPPQILEEYNNAFPGCAERVVAMAERQSAHRQHLEKTVVQGNIAAQSRGQWFAFILAFIVIGGGVYLLANGKSLEGFAAIIIAVGGIVSTLIWTRREQRKEREDKLRTLPQAPRPRSRKSKKKKRN